MMLSCVVVTRRFCGPLGSGSQSAGAGKVRAVVSLENPS